MNETAQAAGNAAAQAQVLPTILFGIMVLAVVAILIVLIIILRKRYIRQTIKFCIIQKDGKIKSSRLANVQKINTVFKKKYAFDQKCVVFRFWSREIYYFDGNPKPINFNAEGKKSKIEMSSIELHNVIEEKITEKLLGNPVVGMGEILQFITIAIVAITLFLVWQMSSNGVMIENVETNVNLLKEIFRTVVTGG